MAWYLKCLSGNGLLIRIYFNKSGTIQFGSQDVQRSRGQIQLTSSSWSNQSGREPVVSSGQQILKECDYKLVQ